MSTGPDRHRGAVLLLVVMVVSLLAAVVGQLCLVTGTAAVAVANDKRTLQHQLALQSGAEYVMARIRQEREVFSFRDGRRPAAGVFELHVGSAEVFGVVDDESAKLHVATACRAGQSREASNMLARAVNRMETRQIAPNVEVLLDIGGSGLAEAESHKLRRLEQLIVSEQPCWPVLYQRRSNGPYVGQHLTVFSDGRVNLLAADQEVLDVALAGLDRMQRSSLREAVWRLGPGATLEAVAETAQLDERGVRVLRDMAATRSTSFSVRLTSVIGHTRRDILAVVDGSAEEPAVVRWCELN